MEFDRCREEDLGHSLMKSQSSINECVRVLLDADTELVDFQMLVVDAAVNCIQRIFAREAESKHAEMTLKNIRQS